VPFLQNEDAALKAKLQGLTVADATSDPVTNRRVEVRFKDPEYAFADAIYPLILISHTYIERSTERESRGYVTLNYAPENYAPWADMADPNASPYTTETPIPIDIHYAIEVYARKQRHLIQLTNALMDFYHLPPRFGFLSVPQDGTIRRLDVLGGPEYTETRDERNKRLFCALYEVLVSSEIIWAQIDTLSPALKVLFDYRLLPSGEPIQ
jgi:hypothetical protein